MQLHIGIKTDALLERAPRYVMITKSVIPIFGTLLMLRSFKNLVGRVNTSIKRH